MADTEREKSIPLLTADRLIAAHDGDVALLYIYRLRTGCADPERTARDLCRTLREIEAADEKLRRLGTSVPPPRPSRPLRQRRCRNTARRILSAAAVRTGSFPRSSPRPQRSWAARSAAWI